jgi:hypothetical protein
MHFANLWWRGELGNFFSGTLAVYVWTLESIGCALLRGQREERKHRGRTQKSKKKKKKGEQYCGYTNSAELCLIYSLRKQAFYLVPTKYRLLFMYCEFDIFASGGRSGRISLSLFCA